MMRHITFKRFLIILALMFLVLNYKTGDVLGFKAFINNQESLLSVNVSLSSRAIKAKEGNSVILNRYESYFRGVLVKDGSNELYVSQGNVSVPIENERVYTEIINIKGFVILAMIVIVCVIKGVKNGSNVNIKKIKS